MLIYINILLIYSEIAILKNVIDVFIFLFSGDGLDYLNLALKEGGVILSMSLGNGKLDLQVKPNKIRFDDNQWHKITVHRKIQEVSKF